MVDWLFIGGWTKHWLLIWVVIDDNSVVLLWFNLFQLVIGLFVSEIKVDHERWVLHNLRNSLRRIVTTWGGAAGWRRWWGFWSRRWALARFRLRPYFLSLLANGNLFLLVLSPLKFYDFVVHSLVLEISSSFFTKLLILIFIFERRVPIFQIMLNLFEYLFGYDHTVIFADLLNRLAHDIIGLEFTKFARIILVSEVI